MSIAYGEGTASEDEWSDESIDIKSPETLEKSQEAEQPFSPTSGRQEGLLDSASRSMLIIDKILLMPAHAVISMTVTSRVMSFAGVVGTFFYLLRTG